MVEKILNWFTRKDGFVRVRAESVAELNDNIVFQKRMCEKLDENIAFQTRKCEELDGVVCELMDEVKELREELDGVVCELMDEVKELREELEALRRPPVYKASEINSGLFGEIMDEFINGPQIKNREDD